MLSRTAIFALVIGCVSTADAGQEFYVARNEATARCTLLDTPPETTAFTLLADGRVFFSKDQADKVLASLEECRRTQTTTSTRLKTRAN